MTPINYIFFPEKNPFLPIIEMDRYTILPLPPPPPPPLTIFNKIKFYFFRLKNVPCPEIIPIRDKPVLSSLKIPPNKQVVKFHLFSLFIK